jgi:hypothetical protein
VERAHHWHRGFKGIVFVVIAAVFVVSMSAPARAAGGSYGDPTKIGGGTYTASTYAITVKDTLYQYATGKDGTAYYTTYDGKNWADWSAWKSQPAKYQYEPAPVSYKDQAYVVYAGKDDKYYFAGSDGDWTDISGDLTFKYAPYANVYNDTLYIYGVASDGYVYWKDYNGSAWGEWGEIGGKTTSVYKVYAVTANDYDNVFWTSDDGHVYWNRWDGSKWTGTKQLTNGTSIASAPYAVGYSKDKKIYAYASSKDGKPAWNVFTEGKGWTGWTAYDGLSSKVAYQPSVYVYKDVQHVAYTGADGHAYYAEYDNGTWSDWTDIGQNYAYDPYQYEYADNLYLTYTGADDSIYVREYAAGGGY